MGAALHVTGHTIWHGRGVMVHGSGRIGGNRMTGQTGDSGMRRNTVSETSVTLAFCPDFCGAGAAASG